MMNTVPTIRLMAVSDIPAGMRLRELAGWNQTEQDWRRLLQSEPTGCFVACLEGGVCGTVTTLGYEKRFGWVGMVLVAPEHRRRGIGTRLLEAGIAYLDEAGVETVKLDATPMGRLVYLQHGFVDEYEIERWAGTSDSGGTGLAPMTQDDLERACVRDRRIFGADRSRLLNRLWQENPRYSAVAYSGGEVVGYVLGRAGAHAHYLGPWVAEPQSGVAERLLREFLNRVRGERVFVDVCLKNPDARALVRAAGFQLQRPLTRMYRGPNNYPGQPPAVCGIAGPELG